MDQLPTLSILKRNVYHGKYGYNKMHRTIIIVAIIVLIRSSVALRHLETNIPILRDMVRATDTTTST